MSLEPDSSRPIRVPPADIRVTSSQETKNCRISRSPGVCQQEYAIGTAPFVSTASGSPLLLPNKKEDEFSSLNYSSHSSHSLPSPPLSFSAALKEKSASQMLSDHRPDTFDFSIDSRKTISSNRFVETYPTMGMTTPTFAVHDIVLGNADFDDREVAGATDTWHRESESRFNRLLGEEEVPETCLQSQGVLATSVPGDAEALSSQDLNEAVVNAQASKNNVNKRIKKTFSYLQSPSEKDRKREGFNALGEMFRKHELKELDSQAESSLKNRENHDSSIRSAPAKKRGGAAQVPPTITLSKPANFLVEQRLSLLKDGRDTRYKRFKLSPKIEVRPSASPLQNQLTSVTAEGLSRGRKHKA